VKIHGRNQPIPLFHTLIPPVSLLLTDFASREQRYTSPLFRS
jgi:hypothetical protein